MDRHKKKKILWLSHFIPYPPKGGMLIRSYNLLAQISTEFDVELIALGREDTMRGMFSSPDAGMKEAYEVLSALCGKVCFVHTNIGSSKVWTYKSAGLGLLMNPPYSIRWFSSVAFQNAVEKAVSRSQFDAIFVDTISLAQYVGQGRKELMILDHHNIESDMLTRRAAKEHNRFRRRYFAQEARRLAAYEKEQCPFFDLHLTCSELDSERLHDIDANLNIAVVPNGVDIEYFVPSVDSAKSAKLIFVGGQGWYPNRDAMEFFATEIWPLLREHDAEVTFDLIGRGPSQVIRELSLSDSRFNSHGFVDDIRPFVNDAAIYVCPIRDGGGTKLKILDALAMGKAIVAHPLAVEGIEVIDGVHVVLADTADEFVEAIILLLSDSEKRHELERNARTLATQRYSYDSIGSQLCSQIEESLAMHDNSTRRRQVQ